MTDNDVDFHAANILKLVKSGERGFAYVAATQQGSDSEKPADALQYEGNEAFYEKLIDKMRSEGVQVLWFDEAPSRYPMFGAKHFKALPMHYADGVEKLHIEDTRETEPVTTKKSP